MKQIILLFILTSAVLLSYSQVNRIKHQVDYKGYTIHLLLCEQGTFGYDIVQGNRIVLHQERNPFNRSHRGLSNAEDAFRVAQWQIDHSAANIIAGMTSKRGIAGLEKLPPAWQQRLKTINGNAIQPIRSRVPMSVAQQLRINVDTH